jgi:hypothetical protein
LNYLNGGGASGLSVQVTSLLRNRMLHFPDYEQFSFYTNDGNEDEQKSLRTSFPLRWIKTVAENSIERFARDTASARVTH